MSKIKQLANRKDYFLWGASLQNASLWDANLQDANLKKVDLQDADLEGAFLLGTKKLTAKQIKSTCFWDKAIYKGEWNEEMDWVATEPDNTNFIEELKNDTASDPEEPIDCSRWEKENEAD